VIVVMAIAVMSVASFLPFLQTPCGGCLRTLTYTAQESRGLAQAPDAWVALALLLVLATVAILHMAGIRPALTAFACLAVSFAAVAFPLVEVGNYGSLVFPGATALNPMTTETGFYTFLLGAAIASLASLTLVLANLPRPKRSPTARLKVPS
jgi:hypothetical protein